MKLNDDILKNYDILLLFTSQTGLGDNYGCLISASESYVKLKENGLRVVSISNQEFDLKLPGKPSLSDYQNLFNYDFFENNIFFTFENFTWVNERPYNEDLNSLYNHYLNINHSHHIYINKNCNFNEVKEIIDSCNILGYSHELISNLEINTPIKFTSLINKDIEYNSSLISSKYKKIIGFHVRLPDGGNLYDNLNDTISNEVKKIINQNNDSHFLISGKGLNFDNFEIDSNKFIKIDKKYSEDKIENLKYDLLEMSLFSYCHEIYTYCTWKSAFMTYPILHNRQNKNYRELIKSLL